MIILHVPIRATLLFTLVPSIHVAVANALGKLGTWQPLHRFIKSLDCMYLLSHVKNCWVALKIANLLAMTWNISLDVAVLQI